MPFTTAQAGHTASGGKREANCSETLTTPDPPWTFRGWWKGGEGGREWVKEGGGQIDG